jgi:hypothetical protein
VSERGVWVGLCKGSRVLLCVSSGELGSRTGHCRWTLRVVTRIMAAAPPCTLALLLFNTLIPPAVAAPPTPLGPSREPGFGTGPEAEPRPVVRAYDAATGRLTKVFTRVLPDARNTSIIIRVREGWEELRASLAADPVAPRPNPLSPKQRWARNTGGRRRAGAGASDRSLGRRERGRRCLALSLASGHKGSIFNRREQAARCPKWRLPRPQPHSPNPHP